MKELWLSMTQTGRELENDDMHKIFKIRKDIEVVLDQFSKLRYEGVSVFARRVNIERTGARSLPFSNSNSANNLNSNIGSTFTTSAQGANIDFVRFYEGIRQNLSYVQENITSYTRKQEVTRNLENAERNANAILRQANSQSSKFNNLANNVFYSKKRTINERDQTIRDRQNQMSVEAVVGILERRDGAGITRL